MKNRIPDYLLNPTHPAEPFEPEAPEWRELARKQITLRIGQAESYLQSHPGAAIGAAFCIGIFLGWLTKRK